MPSSFGDSRRSRMPGLPTSGSMSCSTRWWSACASFSTATPLRSSCSTPPPASWSRRAAKGIEEEVRQGVRIPMGQGFAGRIAAEGRPVILDPVDHTKVVNPILMACGIRSLVGVPLIANGATIGVLHVGTLGRRSFDEQDAELLQLAADRAALAVSAGISNQERIAAATLQRSLAPHSLPKIPGLQLAARYLPGLSGAVGGDWFDVFQLPTGHVATAIGDVAGHGLRSAVVMGRLRSALRAYALESLDPASVLTRLDEMVCQFEPETMATVLYAVFDPALEQLTLSTAGHPGPVIAQPGITPYPIEIAADPPIGSALGVPRRHTTVRVPPGTTLYLFTDGLVERRGTDLDAGMERLRAVATCGPPNAGCTRIISELVGDTEPVDDVALLALQTMPRAVSG
ncbi:MAG: PP2C family protein-serine/threonine phosphatase [Acidimicrobiia bacterium]